MMLSIHSILAVAVQATVYDSRLNIALTLDTPSTGVSTTPEGRTFILWARVDGSTGPQVVEWQDDNTTVPYPDAAWNSWSEGQDASTGFVRVNSQRIGPDGALWLVDTGSPGFGEPVILPDGPKLIQVNLTTNAVARVYPMGGVTSTNSFLDDVRFNGAQAYLTDAGAPALIVLDLRSGAARRVLDDDASTRGHFPASAEGALFRGPDGNPQYIHADQLEVSPDGRWLYYQPASGGMSRVETRYLAGDGDDDDAELARHVEPYAHTPSSGGTAIDAGGNIYVGDTDGRTVLKIAPDGTVTPFVSDPRLLWVDAMWVDRRNRLWMPAAQLNRGRPFNNGTDRIVRPIYVFTVDIGVGPSPIDHA